MRWKASFNFRHLGRRKQEIVQKVRGNRCISGRDTSGCAQMSDKLIGDVGGKTCEVG